MTIPTEAVVPLHEGLCQMGAVDTSLTPSILVLVTPDGHSVVIVPRTGRIQLRLSYLLRIDERPQAAQNLAQTLSDLLESVQ